MLRVIRHPPGRRLSATSISSTPAITSFSGSSTRNDFAGYVGLNFTTSSGKTVSAIGRYRQSSNSDIHFVILFNASGQILSSVRIDMSTGTSGAVKYESLISPLSLAAGTYSLMSQEMLMGDLWFDSAAASGPDISSLSSTFFIKGPTNETIRNDFGGRIGYKFTPNSNQTITHLGTHKIDPSDSSAQTVGIYDLSGISLATVSIPFSGVPTGRIDMALGTPLALTSGTTYFIALEVVNGGNFWLSLINGSTLSADFTYVTAAYSFDISPTIIINEGTDHFPVFFKYGSSLEGQTATGLSTNITSAGQAYVYPNFLYS